MDSLQLFQIGASLLYLFVTAVHIGGGNEFKEDCVNKFGYIARLNERIARQCARLEELTSGNL